MIYSLGIDISKDDFSACLQRYLLNEQTHQVVTRKTFKNNPSGFKACMSWLERHTNDQPAPIRMTMEATGVYYEPLALFIQQHHRQVHLSVVLPSQSKKFIGSQGYRSKTDKIDARGLAMMGAERKLDAWKGIDSFWRELRAMSRTRSQLIDQRTRLKNQLHALAHGGYSTPQVTESLLVCVDTISNQIDELTKLIGKHLRSRKDLAESIACLRSIPGVGTLTIATILAETNGFTQFHSISQLISFSGYDVVIRQSGKWSGKPKISKQGSKYIRKAMYMPASAIVRKENGPIYAFYKRLLSVHNVKMKAHVAVQKKLLTYIYVLWTKGEVFNSDEIRNERIRHKRSVAPPKSEATVDTSVALAQ